MIDPGNVPDVSSDESVARYVLFSAHIRRSDGTLKPDAFIPPPDLELSVTRHLAATEAEIWQLGEDVARQRERTMYGRGDLGVGVCHAQQLAVRAASIAGNPNHAHILDWPTDKPTQKIIALELAAACRFVEKA